MFTKQIFEVTQVQVFEGEYAIYGVRLFEKKDFFFKRGCLVHIGRRFPHCVCRAGAEAEGLGAHGVVPFVVACEN